MVSIEGFFCFQAKASVNLASFALAIIQIMKSGTCLLLSLKLILIRVLPNVNVCTVGSFFSPDSLRGLAYPCINSRSS